jgi:hypothetical protein
LLVTLVDNSTHRIRNLLAVLDDARESRHKHGCMHLEQDSTLPLPFVLCFIIYNLLVDVVDVLLLFVLCCLLYAVMCRAVLGTMVMMRYRYIGPVVVPVHNIMLFVVHTSIRVTSTSMILEVSVQ